MAAHSVSADLRSRLAVSLPALPQMLLKLMEYCQSDDIGMDAFAGLIAKDAAMTATVLRVANSSAYHRGRQSSANLEQALIAIGSNMVKTILISESVSQVFANFSRAGSTDLRGFWKHAITAGVMARLIAAKMDYPFVEEAYLAGLLHDVGRLALLAAAPADYADNFHAPEDDNLCAVEERAFGITHAEAGAWIIESWQLDSFMADSVRYHHEPAVRIEAAHPLIRIISLTHHLCTQGQTDRVAAVAGALCGLHAGDLDTIAERAQAEVREAAEYLGIDLNAADEARPVAVPPPDPVQLQLGQHVQSLSIMSEVARTFAEHPEQSALLDAISQSARILFSFKDVAILLVDSAEQELQAAATDGHRQRLSSFAIPLGAGGRIADAVAQERLAYIRRSQDALGIFEEQLLRILDAGCLLCLPLTNRRGCVGVLVGALDERQLDDLRKRETLLHAFASQATAALVKGIGARTAATDGLASLAQEYRDATRRVAHEVNNPLSIIRNYLSVLDRKLSRQESIDTEISILNEEIDRIGQLVDGLADLQPATQDGTADINAVINAMVRLFRDSEFAPASVTIAARTPDERCEVAGGIGSLRQIFMNLLKNAVEALPDGGEIEIVNNGLINCDGRLYVEVLVSDTGSGMPAEVMANLFLPTRSSKGKGHQGLGLSIVKGLVKQIDGRIGCRSSVLGTTFEVWLPVLGQPERVQGALMPIQHKV
ncbi:HDOD domain-containing protein [Noviherbaspirillum cavernae]|uniref:histidine kinase n=2 Tax=Noviherbaspirillum cavernae TaxID=2320862 RepID=A0A418WWG3_9BURK|nr:HDOD domain-containing protein [Noviherbaspirillum cavernae]